MRLFPLTPNAPTLSWRRLPRNLREQIIDLLSKGKKIEADGRLMTDPGHPKYLGVSKKKGLLPEEIETISTFVLEQVLCFQRATDTHTCSTFAICVDGVFVYLRVLVGMNERRMHARTHVCICMHVCLYVSARVCVCVYVCLCLCTCVHVYMHILT